MEDWKNAYRSLYSKIESEMLKVMSIKVNTLNFYNSIKNNSADVHPDYKILCEWENCMKDIINIADELIPKEEEIEKEIENE